MEGERDRSDLEQALRHCRAGLTAIEAAHRSATETGAIYATHLHVGTVELARAIELAMKVALRNPSDHDHDHHHHHHHDD